MPYLTKSLFKRGIEMLELIAMFFCGFFCSASIAACVIVSLVFKKDDCQFPTDDDMEQMCIWYEDQYGKDV